MTSRSIGFPLLLCIWCVFVGSTSGQETSESPKMPKISAKAMAALLLDAPTPEFPKNPMAKCSNAMVTLDAVVGADGRVNSVRAVSGFEQFRDSALAAVKQWVYRPYIVNGTAAAVQTTIFGHLRDGHLRDGHLRDGRNNPCRNILLPTQAGDRLA